MRHPVRSAIPFLALLFSLPALASITGTVMNGDGGAVVGAKVSAFAPETAGERRAGAMTGAPQRKAMATATTGNDGSFRLEVPKETIAVDLRIDAAGYAPEGSWALGEDDAGAIVLTRAAMKSGTITAGGKPVAKANVYLIAGQVVYAATTDEKGRYSVPDPAKWAQRLMIVHPDHALVSDTSLLRDPMHMKLDQTLTAGVAVSGRVVAEDGSPVGGAELFVDRFPAGKSADDGTFSIPHAKNEWRTIEARSGARVAMRAHGSGAVTLKLSKGATLSGTVVDEKTQLPVPGATVGLMPGGLMGGETVESAFTDMKGVFTIGPLPPGNYALNADRSGYAVPRGEVALMGGRTLQKALYAAPYARVSGTVVDEARHPVAAARISTRAAARDAMSMMMFGRPGNRGGVYSGPDGRFVARDVEGDGDVIVDAAKKGFPPAHTPAMRLAAGEKKSGVVLTIPRGIVFSGRVIDKNGKPVSGASVDAAEASSDMGGPFRRMILMATNRSGDDVVKTASDGTFTVRVKEGKYDVSVRAEGYAAKSLRAQSVTPGMKPVEIVLEPGVEITGRVVRGGMGVDGVNVAAVSMDGMQAATTAPDGSFRLADLTPGTVMLSVNRQDAFIQEMRNVTAPARDLVIEVPAGGRITGRVVDKVTHEPVTSFQAGVSTSRGGGGMVMQMPPMLKPFTSDDGSFTLDNVRPGPTQVVAAAPGYTQGRVANVEVEDGKTTSGITVEMETGVKLIGTVTGSDGAPLPGVSVSPDSSRGGRVMTFDRFTSATVTDPKGEYAIEAQEPGEKTFSFSRNGYLSERRTVNLTGKEVRVDVQLSSGLRVGGVVVTEGGSPVAEATVRASSAADSGFGREAHSDANGNFQFEGLAPGHYTFTAVKSGYANGVARDVDVTAAVPLRVTMKSGATISGHVSGLTAEELSQATVTATTVSSGMASAPIDAGGNYRMEGAPTGTVRLTARTGTMFGGSSKSSEAKTVVVDPGGSATADLEFKSTTVVRGHVTRNGHALGNAMLYFYPKGGRTQTNASTTADAAGYYELGGLDDGPYTVQVVDFARLSPFVTSYEVKGSSTFDIDIRTAAVRGRVVDATNEQPLGDALVELRSKGTDTPMGTRTVMTDGAGNFIADSVARGAYQISADKEGYGHVVRDLDVQDAPAEVELKLSPSAGVTLRVVDGRDGRLLSVNARVVDMQGRALDDGGFRFGGSPEPVKLTLSPGTYRVTLAANGYAPRTINVTSPSEQTVPMTPGGALLIRSKSSTPTRARLIAGDGLPYYRGGMTEGIFPVAAAPGVTTLPNVAPGTYRLELLDNADRVTGTSSVTINEGVQTTIDV